VNMASLPNGFQLSWLGDAVRVRLPPLEIIDAHAYEPVISQRDVERIVDAIDLHHEKRRRAGNDEPLRSVEVARDTRYSRAALSRFRAQLSFALVERGYDAAIDERTTTAGFATV
jgi:hypothetical protein